MNSPLKSSAEFESFYYKKGKVGCLLCHGFTGTPKEVKELGIFLAEHDITVIGPRLPGHGTTIEEMITTSKKDWYTEYIKAYKLLREHCDEIFIGGLSMGAALSIKCALNNPVDGLILMAAPLNMPLVTRIFLATIAPIAKKATIKKSDESLELAKKLDNECYQRDPIGPANSLRSLLRENRKRLKEISIPTLILQGLKDANWLIRSAKKINNRISSEIKELHFLENSPHCLTIGPEKDLVKSIVLNFIREQTSILK